MTTHSKVAKTRHSSLARIPYSLAWRTLVAFKDARAEIALVFVVAGHLKPVIPGVLRNVKAINHHSAATTAW